MSGVRFEDLEFVNYKNIIDAIGAMESPSRASVAKALAVSKTTVSYVVSDLIEKGIVEETELQDSGRRGRPGLGLRLRDGAWCALGAAFISSHWSFVVTGLSGRVIFRHEAPEISVLTPDSLLSSLKHELKEIMSSLPHTMLPAIGLGLPGIVDIERNRIIVANDMKWHDPIDFGSEIEKEFGIRVYSVNRYTAAGIAEFRYANPERDLDMIYIGLGHGIRSAIFINGRLLSGATYSAGRIAHIVVDQTGPLCDCGKKGCLLTLASSDVLIRKADELRKLDENRISRLNDEGVKLDEETICTLADEYDTCAMKAIDTIVEPLARGLGEICDIINPRKIIIGGPIGYSSRYLVTRLRECLRQKLTASPAGEVLKVEQACLKDYGSALGAASLVLENKADLLYRAENVHSSIENEER